MIKVKVSTPWSHTDYDTRISSYRNTKFKFYFDDGEEEFDFWIVWGGIKDETQTVKVSPGNLIYLTDEVHEERFFNRRFIEQFAAIITCRTDITHQKLIHSHELNTWIVGRDFESLYNTNSVSKTKELSVVCSDQTWLPGHKLRYAFVNKLIGHFKDKLDVYGRGFNYVADKYDALAPYKYSIAIENSAITDYFTEKITDCYLTHTMPLYYGCPNIEDYFDNRSFASINPHHLMDSIRKIEQIMEDNTYDQVVHLLRTEKKKYLDQYHIFSKLENLLTANFNLSGKKVPVTIRNESCFKNGYYLNRTISSIFNRLHIPGRLFFYIHFDQSKTFINKKP